MEMSCILKFMKGLYCWLLGHFFAILFYDKQYLKGRWFESELNGLYSVGWKWVLRDAMGRILLGDNKEAKYPVAHGCRVVHPSNIDFSPDDLNNFQTFGVYFQAHGKITIGHGCYIGPNVGLITSNHEIKDLDNHLPPKPIVLGENCWIGMNSVILGGGNSWG